jgi:hypothetical protein
MKPKNKLDMNRGKPPLKNIANSKLWIEKSRRAKDAHTRRKEDKLKKMTDKEIMDSLKDQSLPTFGTKLERENRLRKAWGKKIEFTNF